MTMMVQKAFVDFGCDFGTVIQPNLDSPEFKGAANAKKKTAAEFVLKFNLKAVKFPNI